jgi:hypothetical protein
MRSDRNSELLGNLVLADLAVASSAFASPTVKWVFATKL